MESLAVFVGFMLLSLLIAMVTAFSFSFIRKPFAKIITIVTGLYSIVLGSILMFNSDGGLNLLLVGLIPTVVGLTAIAISFLRSRNIEAS
jgi:ABC-type glycerol-3-phosphate transport system permease component